MMDLAMKTIIESKKIFLISFLNIMLVCAFTTIAKEIEILCYDSR